MLNLSSQSSQSNKGKKIFNYLQKTLDFYIIVWYNKDSKKGGDLNANGESRQGATMNAYEVIEEMIENGWNNSQIDVLYSNGKKVKKEHYNLPVIKVDIRNTLDGCGICQITKDTRAVLFV